MIGENELLFELITAALTRDDDDSYVKYAFERVESDVADQYDAQSLVAVFGLFAAGVIEAWAQDTDRDPLEVLRAMAVASAAFAGEEDDEDDVQG